MKKIFTIAAALLMTASVWAQAPEKMSYQAVVRDASNSLITTQVVGMQISILQGGATGTPVYVETQTQTTNANGLVSLEIGTGTLVSGDFTTIDWANGPYFIKTETDPTGGTTYTITGTSQLMSVPYALYAKESGNSTPGPQGPAGIDGADGAVGPQGPAGNDGADGTNGTDGLDGADGATGAQGIQGVAGADGTNGTDGLDGADGATGAQGIQGVAGADGTNGTDGLDGATGATGAQGIQGVAGMDGTNGTDGLDGATGATGAQGIQGVAGADGTNGTDGLDGADGATGAQGIQGVAGADGTNGATGPAGADGTNGTNGLDGATGPAGADGTNGTNGLDGATGPAGADGTNGTNGLDGATGPAGADGTNGTDGVDGATGATGAAGTDGTDGVDGATGATGAAGTDGTNGTDGLDGAVGATGAAGTDGTDGLDGATGATGAAGTDGTNGTDGLDGATGATGATGTFQSGTVAGQMQYWNGTAWVSVTPGTTGQNLTNCNGVPTWTTGGACPSSTPNVTNATTGKIWMDRNLGASQAATSSTDAASYGDLYQWGRGTDGHQIRTSPTTTTLSAVDQPGNGNFITINSGNYDWRSTQNDNLWQGVNGVNNPCPTGYRLPTDTELDAERLSWGTNNAAGAFGSPLKLPMSGYRDLSDGSLNSVGTLGLYWSSTVSGTSSRDLGFNSSVAFMYTYFRAYGFSVRCLKD